MNIQCEFKNVIAFPAATAYFAIDAAYCGTSFTSIASVDTDSLIATDIESYQNILEARQALEEGDFLGYEESEKLIASILNASS